MSSFHLNDLNSYQSFLIALLLVWGLQLLSSVKRKKTKSGVEIKSTVGALPPKKPIWWLAIIEKKRVQIFSYSLSTKNLEPVFSLCEPDYHEAVDRLIRDSAGRSQASYTRSQGGHQTGHPRHSYSSILSPDQKAAGHLFKTAASFLKKEGKKETFQALALIGHPHSLGQFREFLDAKTLNKITLQSKSFANYVSPRKQVKRLLSLLPIKSEQPGRWLPTQNMRKG